MPLRSFRDLIVWQKAMRLARETYCLVKLLPMEERYALSDQMRRAAVSIPSNIAEGQSRHTKTEFIQFLHIAKGSNSELMTQFLLCLDFEYLKKEEIQKVMNLCTEIDGLLGGLIKSLKTNLV